jgi:hypothetical protein
MVIQGSHRDYIKRIEYRIGAAKAADIIEEGPCLNIVVKESNDISNDYAKQLEREIAETNGIMVLTC